MKLFKMARKYGARVVVGGGALVGSALALAQQATTYTVFDASPAGASILGLIAGMLVIGGAVFALHLAIKSTKWGRKAL